MNISDDIVRLFKESEKIIVFTGAGVSTNCGIPDFRGPEGLYTFVGEKYNLPFPEAIFEINYFNGNPKPFYDFSREMRIEELKPSFTHQFIADLEKENRLELVITQNIDMLHRKAGNRKVLECHGTYTTGHCMNCHHEYRYEEYKENLETGKVKYCDCGGVVKPDVVFFGEQLPGKFHEIYERPPQTDLFVAMGTSLTVYPAAGLALKILERDVPSILINMAQTEYDGMFSYVFHEDVDEFCRSFGITASE